MKKDDAIQSIRNQLSRRHLVALSVVLSAAFVVLAYSNSELEQLFIVLIAGASWFILNSLFARVICPYCQKRIPVFKHIGLECPLCHGSFDIGIKDQQMALRPAFRILSLLVAFAGFATAFEIVFRGNEIGIKKINALIVFLLSTHFCRLAVTGRGE